MARHYSNTTIETTLALGVGPSDTQISVTETSGMPASFPFTLILDYQGSNVEVVTVTGLSGSFFTVDRGQDGTAAQAHDPGTTVVHGATARDLREPQVHIDTGVDVHGVGATGSVVGTDTTQTLTSKTISGSSNTLSNIPSSAVAGLDAALSDLQTDVATNADAITDKITVRLWSGSAYDVVDGPTLYVGSNEPSSPVNGDVWLETE